MNDRDKLVYEKMIKTIEARLKSGHPRFGDHGALRDYKERLAKLK